MEADVAVVDNAATVTFPGELPGELAKQLEAKIVELVKLSKVSFAVKQPEKKPAKQ